MTKKEPIPPELLEGIVQQTEDFITEINPLLRRDGEFDNNPQRLIDWRLAEIKRRTFKIAIFNSPEEVDMDEYMGKGTVHKFIILKLYDKPIDGISGEAEVF